MLGTSELFPGMLNVKFQNSNSLVVKQVSNGNMLDVKRSTYWIISQVPPTSPQNEISGTGSTVPPTTSIFRPSTSSNPAISLFDPNGFEESTKVKLLVALPSGYVKFSAYGATSAFNAVSVGYKLKYPIDPPGRIHCTTEGLKDLESSEYPPTTLWLNESVPMVKFADTQVEIFLGS